MAGWVPYYGGAIYIPGTGTLDLVDTLRCQILGHKGVVCIVGPEKLRRRKLVLSLVRDEEVGTSISLVRWMRRLG